MFCILINMAYFNSKFSNEESSLVLVNIFISAAQSIVTRFFWEQARILYRCHLPVGTPIVRAGVVAGGREYAIIGHYAGTTVYDVTDAPNIVNKGTVTGPGSFYNYQR
ncbi:MAG: hypothetical protein IPG99_02580 [Ignavibacteria bacterium]|nr:hypothetical protein [Ignavibacteria bacterium]